MPHHPRELLTGPGRLLLLRHGQAAGDQERLFLGQGDPALSELGRAQAAWWRDELAGLGLKRIVASDLSRTQETAAIIAESQGLPVELEPRLREVDLGRWEGLARDEVARRWPQAYAARGADPAGFRPPGGESFGDLAARAWPVLASLAAWPGTVLVVTHAGVLRMALGRLLGLPWSALFGLRPALAGLWVADWSGPAPRLVAQNLIPLLAA